MSKKWFWLVIVAVAVAGIMQGLREWPAFRLPFWIGFTGPFWTTEVGHDFWEDPFGIVGFFLLSAVAAIANIIVWLCLPAIVGVIVKLVTRRPWRTVMGPATRVGLVLATYTTASMITHTLALAIQARY